MLGFLRSSPYVLAILIAVLTAGLSWAYAKTLSTDPNVPKKTFNKTLVAALVAGLSITWMVNRQEAVSTEPFMEP